MSLLPARWSLGGAGEASTVHRDAAAAEKIPVSAVRPRTTWSGRALS